MRSDGLKSELESRSDVFMYYIVVGCSLHSPHPVVQHLVARCLVNHVNSSFLNGGNDYRSLKDGEVE